MDPPEFEAEIPGAETWTYDEALLVRNDFRLAWRGLVFRACLGKRMDEEAREVRGDWFGVKNRSGLSSSEESKPSKSSESSSRMLFLGFVRGDLALPEGPEAERCWRDCG